jgi:endonuclease YncB( thermonuclease family)
MKTGKKTFNLGQMIKYLHWTTRHRRLGLFWLTAFIGLALPWLPSFSMDASLSCTVNSIYDGDTMRVTCEGKRMKVRLYCIDAPEMGQRPWGRESRDYLRSIVTEHIVVVSHGKDRYGRTIGEVTTDGERQQNLNLAMVQLGYAAVYPKYCHAQEYYRAEAEAKKSQSGIWSKPGTHQQPWEWRSLRR